MSPLATMRPMPLAHPHRFVRHQTLLPHLELRLASGSRDCYQTHTHEEYAFGTVDAGEALFRHGRGEETLSPLRAGMTVMMEPGLAHSCNPSEAQAWSYRMLYVDASWLHRSFLPLGGETGALPLSQHASDSREVYAALSLICEALAAPCPPDPLELNEQLLNFVADHALQARAPEASPTPLAGGAPASDDTALHAVRQRIETQMSQALSLEELAQLGGWSEFQLLRRFKHAFGLTPHAYQIDLRLNRAKRLLRQGLPLSEVALELGFSDQSHFQRHFKKRHATTPGNYQSRD
ncbi:AraC family transcriptional regulator [Kinneretia aquatilis]|uniref:AraC family transcriptional regulator n=1 Tax=Kinneretia aquatilis TaxID=2070761 RepID=UPI002557E87C|nr:AraC family transcriptional regulator [Paucibacter aquatile]WIV97131.1 AraC family transcriptional regulator [Paucibacter aquatile]